MEQAAQSILLVEDEAIIALGRAQTLESRGYRVRIVHDGESAVEAGLDETIDLILMDIDLGHGKMDGAEAAELILLRRDVPIVFLSSHTEPEIVDKTEAIASYGYVVKNTPTTALDASIKMALRLSRTRCDLRESEEKYRAAFTTSPDAININRLDGLYVDINDGFIALTGYTRDEVIGKLSSEIAIWAIPEDRERLIDGLQRDGAVENLQSDFRCKNGEIRTCLMSARVIRMNNQPHILSITRDISAQIRSEIETQSRERRLQAIFDHAADGILIGDGDGRITDGNHKILSLTGYTRDELIGAPIDILFDRSSLIDHPLRYGLLLQGKTVQQERIVRTKTGEPVPVVTNSTQVEPGCLQSIFHDVSDLRRTEAALQESEERFRLAVEGTSDGLWDWNLTTNEAFHSERFETMLGYDPGELPDTETAWSDLLHPDDRQRAFDEVRKYLDGAVGRYDSLFRMRAKDGSYRWMRGRGKALFDPEGKPLRFVGFNTDVTEDRHIQGRLEESETKYRQVIASANEAIMVFDSDGRFLLANPAAAGLFGLSPAEVEGQLLHDLIPQEMAEERRKGLRQVFATGEGHITVHAMEINQELRWFRANAQPVRGADGEVRSVLVMSSEISAEKKHEAVREQNQKALTFLSESAVALLLTISENEIIEYIGHSLLHLYPGCVAVYSSIEESTGSQVIKRIFGLEYFLEDHQMRDLLPVLEGAIYRIDRDIRGTFKPGVLQRSDVDVEDLARSFAPDPVVVRAIGAITINAVYRIGISVARSLVGGISLYTSPDTDIDPPEFMETFVRQIETAYTIHRKQRELHDTQTALTKALDQRNALMREMNHRIKNNLATITSLIDLKQRSFDDSVDLSDLKERIESFRTLHEMLSIQDTDSLEIDARTYLTDIIERICASFTLRPVALDVDIPPLLLPIHTAIPVGLIATEVATNAIKYGLTQENASFRVSISMERPGTSTDGPVAVLTIANGGNPLPTSFDPTTATTLGIHLIRALTTQIGGQLDVHREPETTFIVRFPIDGGRGGTGPAP